MLAVPPFHTLISHQNVNCMENRESLSLQPWTLKASQTPEKASSYFECPTERKGRLHMQNPSDTKFFSLKNWCYGKMGLPLNQGLFLPVQWGSPLIRAPFYRYNGAPLGLNLLVRWVPMGPILPQGWGRAPS